MISLRQTIFIAILCSLTALSGCGGDYNAEKAYWQYVRVNTAVMKDPATVPGDAFNKATDSLSRIIKRYPQWRKSSELQLILAQMFAARSDLAAAEREYRALISGFPQQYEICALAQYSLGAIAEQQGRVADAATEFQRIIEIYPTTSIGLKIPAHMVAFRRRHGTAADAETAFQQSLRHYQNLIETNPFADMVPAIQEALVNMCYENGKTPDAIKALQRFIDAHAQAPAVPGALLASAHLYRASLKQPARAIEDYEQIITKTPQSKQAKTALLELTGMLAAAGSYDKAYAQVATVGKLYPADTALAASLRAAIAYSYDVAGQWPKAAEELTAIMKAYPETSPALQLPLAFINHAIKAGKTDEQQNAFRDAQSFYRHVIERTKNTAIAAEAQEMYAAACILMKQPTTALDALRVLREQYPADDRASLAKLKMAAIYENDLKDPEKAIAAYRQFLGEYPLHKLAYYARTQIERINAAGKKSEKPTIPA